MEAAMNSPTSLGIRQRLGALFIALAAASAMATTAPAAQAAPVESVEEGAADAFWWADFEKLEALYARARQSHVRDAQGKRDIDHFRTGVARVFNGHDSDSSAYFAQLVHLTRSYAEAHSQSSLAHVLVARALYARAWAVRGGGYAREVPPPAMAAFAKDVRAAEQYLADHASAVMGDTTAHIYLLMIGRSAGWSHEKHWAVLRDALRRDPDEWGVYSEMMVTMLPKWGGDADQLEAIAQDAVKRTEQTLGQAMYAAVYMTAVDDFEADFFRQTHARWGKMKRAFDDLLAHYPDPINLNRYAMVACLAEDKPVAAKLLDDIGNAPVVREWGGNPRGQRRFDACRRWAREK
jgi:hypothetical protein